MDHDADHTPAVDPKLVLGKNSFDPEPPDRKGDVTVDHDADTPAVDPEPPDRMGDVTLLPTLDVFQPPILDYTQFLILALTLLPTLDAILDYTQFLIS